MNISKIRTLMAQEGIVFSFSGLISQELTSFMIESVRIQFEIQGEDRKMVRSMFHIAIEQLQNIMNYSRNKDTVSENRFISPGVLVIGFCKDKQKYYVTSSNEIYEEDKKNLSTKLDLINSFEKADLRKLAREKLRSAEDQHERGAGIGFIEMAKKSSEELEYDFEAVNEKLYFHILTYI